MLLMAAVVQIEDATALSDALVAKGLRLTKINSTGGLFAADSVALLLGLDESHYDDVVATIVETCHTRMVHMSSVAMLDPTFLYLTPMEVEVGGAVVFCVPVERFARFPMTTATPSSSAPPIQTQETDAMTTPESTTDQTTSSQRAIADATVPAPATAGGGESADRMKLIVAIVKGEDADEVIRELLKEGHRLTRINTTGGFLRRGNATLLIGVKASQVDEVVNLIEDACPRRSEPAPLDKGMPEFSATVFVLDASHFLRI